MDRMTGRTMDRTTDLTTDLTAGPVRDCLTMMAEAQAGSIYFWC